MFQVRIHGRGGQGVVTGAEMLSIAAFLGGKHPQVVPSFGSERTDAPVVAFCRIDDKEIRLLLSYGVISLAIGLLFLVACLGLRSALASSTLLTDRTIADEGLLIVGWVAMWRPTEVLLYEWWPLARRVRLLHWLSVIQVQVQATDT